MTTSGSPPLPAWSDQVPLLIDLAVADLGAGGAMLPTMVAFRGDRPLFLATLRPFDRGRHVDAIIEVGALAMGLAADRVLLSLAGRAWSTRDPVPPVLDGVGDLRQHVLVLHHADATTEDPISLSTIIPVDIDDDDTVSTGPPLTDVAGEGWVPRALLALVSDNRPDRHDLADLGLQVRRCESLGHRVAWSPTVMDLIDRARLADVCGEVDHGLRWDAEVNRSGQRAASCGLIPASIRSATVPATTWSG